MISFETKYKALRKFIDRSFDGIEIQEFVFGFEMKDPVEERVILGAEELITEMNLAQLPIGVDSLMDKMSNDKRYPFLYDFLTRHNVLTIDLPKPKPKLDNYDY